ncbi:hypothetical protein HOLleu_15202 [Holothuria leucospilota]|uniref:Fibronectin type-III domain-containing protein n=1 Tax=Holothuria leucospilota TaxID=206669 RepID=A0A9Q1HD45_HOLLE|nr:hypothetical protein HOLleu_15202 [Holothuria leucospilota]
MQSSYDEELSSDITTFQFRTAQSAPEYGPTISGFEVVKRYCDFRDVNVTWEEHNYLRQTVNLTHYEVSFKSVEEPSYDVNVVVPASAQSTNISGLIRWLKYHVTITSRNSVGKKEGKMSVLERDEELLDTYKAEIKGITKTSSSEGKITWEPPRLHELCILGYEIETYTDGSLEQSLAVNGYNTSSATIEFKKSGRYNIDLQPIYNDTLDKSADVKTTYDYIFKARTGYGLAFLSIGMLLVIVTVVSGVTIVARKLICSTENLLDISKSKPMRIASNNHFINTVLKEPPEKECFDSTRGSFITEVKCKTKYTVDHDINDEVFHPASTSETPLLTVNITNDNTKKDLVENIVEVQTVEKSKLTEAKDQQDLIKEVETSMTVSVTTSSTNLEVSVTSNLDGYVARSPKKNPSLTVTIPKEEGYCPPSLLSAQSSSADSGICTSPLFGAPFTDYVPPSPFADSSTEFNITSHTSDSEEFPYVKADLAVTSGRIQSQSVSSETGSDCPTYNRVDSTQFVHDPPPNGYLPRSPSHPIDIENMNGKLDKRPCSYFFPSYTKLSPKRFSQT